MKSQYEKTRFWVTFLGLWVVGGVILGAIIKEVIPYFIGGFFILLIVSMIHGIKFDKELAKEDKEAHKKFSKNLKEITKLSILWELGGLVIYTLYILILKLWGVDITAVKIVIGVIFSILFYWILQKKGLLGFANSDKKGNI